MWPHTPRRLLEHSLKTPTGHLLLGKQGPRRDEAAVSASLVDAVQARDGQDGLHSFLIPPLILDLGNRCLGLLANLPSECVPSENCGFLQGNKLSAKSTHSV